MIPTQEHMLQTFAAGLTSAFLVGNKETIAPKAKALPKYFSSSEGVCVLPSLKLGSSSSKANFPTMKRSRGVDRTSMSQDLRHPLRLCKNATSAVPSALLGNLKSSFQTLLNSKLRHTMRGLADNILKSETSATKTTQATHIDIDALKILMLASSTQSALSVKGGAAVYYALPARKAKPGVTASRQLHLPLVMEAIFDISILKGRDVSMQLRIPGTITGTFTDHLNRLDKVEIIFDSDILFNEMIFQCQDLVRRAVVAAYKLASQPTVEKARAESREGGFAGKTVTNTVAISMTSPPPTRRDKKRARRSDEGQDTERGTCKKRRIAVAA